MKTLEELNVKIAELEAAVIADEKQDDDNATALQAVIADLQQKLEGTTTDFSAQFDQLNAILGNLHAPAGTDPGTGTVTPS